MVLVNEKSTAFGGQLSFSMYVFPISGNTGPRRCLIMSENKRSFGGRGYYIGLVLCAAAVGILSYVYTSAGEV